MKHLLLPPLLLSMAICSVMATANAAGAPTAAPDSPAGSRPDPLGVEPPPIVADPPASQVQPQAISPTLGEKAKDTAAAALPSDTPAAAERARDLFSRMRGEDPNAYSIVSVSKGLSTHKPMYMLPVSYSPDYSGAQTEMIFAISAKVQLFSTPFYFGYSQRSFWQVYDSDRSRPFRETDYNPELFYRWTPDPKRWHYWGADLGAEHESNGQDVPDSRSWNRLYIAPFHAQGKSLWYLKAWYRLPEDKKETPDDPKGDDNPDIEDQYGYGEIHWQRQLGRRQALHTMVRMNPETGHGALNINYTIPSRDGSVFYQLYVWQGYGESLLDYNRSITRVGLGLAFSR